MICEIISQKKDSIILSRLEKLSAKNNITHGQPTRKSITENNKIRNTKQSVSQSKSNVQERQASNRRDIDSNSGYSGGSHGELSNEAGRTNKDLQGKVSNRNQESFIPSQNIRKAISNGKINLIREAMIMDIAKSPYFYSEIVSFVLKKITAQDLWNDSSRVLIKEKGIGTISTLRS